MTKEMCEGSGCKFEKNSVNCPCKDGDIMSRKERDYKAEYTREKEISKQVKARMKVEKYEMFASKLALHNTNANAIINKWIDMYLAGTLE